MRRFILGLGLLSFVAGSAVSSDGLRVAAWNISNYSGGNTAAITTAVYGTFTGHEFAPDVILLQEMTSASAVSSLVSALNLGLGEPGEWVAAPFFGGSSGGLNTALVYRESRLDLVAATLLWSGSASQQPRNIVRYDLRLEGYGSDEALISMYPVHMKAGSSSDDQQRRLLEAQRIRENAETLPAGRHFILGGDTNTQSSSQPGYVELVGVQANNAGRFFDPIAAPGSWNNSSAYRNIHTQDPVGGGGMDDRHDQLLSSATLGDGEGLEYIGAFGQPWDLSRWDDPAHSYRCWGNDGSSFNLALRTDGNVAVGAVIAQSLRTLGGASGHLPVFMDLRVPARVGSDLAIDFGTVEVGAAAEATLGVFNAGDTALWGVGGVGDLGYTLSAPAGFSAPAGSFSEAAGGGLNTHLITMDTSTPGVFAGTLLVLSNDPEEPVRAVSLTGEVVGASCAADLAAPFGVLDLADINAFTAGFLGQDPIADLAPPSGVLDLADINAFVDSFASGCP